jgi:hypothetical protein
MITLMNTRKIMGPNENYNALEVHPQLCHNQHYVDGALLGFGSLWFEYGT